MGYKIKSLYLLKYYGEHRDKLDFYFGFKKRLIANHYTNSSGKNNFEQLYYQVVIFEKLGNKFLRDINFDKFSTVAKEKLTQLLIDADDIINQVKNIEQQLNRQTDRKFNLTERYFKVLNQIELFIVKLVSFLDLLSKLSSYFYKKIEVERVPGTYGRQKYMEGRVFKYRFDTTYQNRLLKNKLINELHSYRNKFSHESSLKIIPYQYRGKWRLTISEGNKEGLKIIESIEKAIKELSRFINYYDRYFLNLSAQ